MSEKPTTPATAYLYLVPLLTKIARANGYALAVHGSMQRDLDVVCVPWTESAVEPEALVAALYEGVKWTAPPGLVGPEEKPHGRRAWALPLDGGLYIDISVTPRGCK